MQLLPLLREKPQYKILEFQISVKNALLRLLGVRSPLYAFPYYSTLTGLYCFSWTTHKPDTKSSR